MGEGRPLLAAPRPRHERLCPPTHAGRLSWTTRRSAALRQTPHLPLSPERVTPGGAGRLTPEARARSELASPPHRRQTRVKLITCIHEGLSPP
uniref:Uncharacterized protein n=1 Tax=Knipowitschia caucasica TaxID=637954 RepID=A0AAV2LEV1_KNICA